MDEETRIITEKDCPISVRWLFKLIGGGLIWSLVAAMMPNMKHLQSPPDPAFVHLWFYLWFFIVIPVFSIYMIIYRKNMRYSFEEERITVKAAVISTTEKNIPYARIQNVYVSVDWIDRCLNLADLIIEIASKGGNDLNKITVFGSQNKIIIRGLDVGSAEYIKEFVMKKITSRMLHDGQSGV